MSPKRQRNLSPEELRIELDNPQAPADDILVALGPFFPYKALTRLSPIMRLGAMVPKQKILAVRPKDSKECSLFLEACWLCGPATFKAGLHQALGMEWSDSTPWTNALRSAGPLARPWLLEWLRGCQDPILAFNILRIIPTPASELPEDFERIARSNYPGLRRLATSALDQLGESARLAALLDTPGVLTSEFDYFRSVIWPDVVPALIRLLKVPHLAEPALECLKLQTKSDLGLDYEAWNNWQQGSPDRRLGLSLAAGNRTALLLQSQQGQLRPDSLKRQQRLIRIFDPIGQLDRNGRYYRSPGSFCSLTEDSPHPIQSRQSACLARECILTWTDNGDASVCDLRSGEALTRWRFDPEKMGSGIGYCSDSDLYFLLEKGLLDARDGRTLVHWGSERRWGTMGGNLAVVRAIDSSVTEFWELSSGNLRFRVAGDLLWNASGLAVIQNDALFEFWDLSSGTLRFKVQGDELVRASDPNLKLLHRRDGLYCLDLQGNLKPLPLAPSKWCRLSPSGKYLAVYGDEDRVPVYDTRTTLLLGIVPDNQVFIAPDGTRLTPHLNVYPDTSTLAETRPGEDEGTVDSGGCHRCWMGQVFEVHPQPSVPPPEYQQLYAELWTGAHLRAGLAEKLNLEEYDSRRRRWRDLTGQDWSTSCEWPSAGRVTD